MLSSILGGGDILVEINNNDVALALVLTYRMFLGIMCRTVFVNRIYNMAEHTFDNSRIRTDFPELISLEESILEGFVRIRMNIRKTMSSW